MGLNLPIPTLFVGIYIAGDFYQLRNLLTGKMIPVLYPDLKSAMDAQRSMDWYECPDWWDDMPEIDVSMSPEDNIANALAAEVRAWDEVIERVTLHV